MADLDARLNQLISDQESRQKVLDAAKAILAQRDSVHPERESLSPAPAPAPEEKEIGGGGDLSQLLSSLLARQATSGEESENPLQSTQNISSAIPELPTSPLLQALPQLMGALSGKEDLVDHQRLDLLRAMRPYLREERAGSIDRAVRMANLTKAAASAMHLLGR